MQKKSSRHKWAKSSALFSLSFLTLSINQALAVDRLDEIHVSASLDNQPILERKVGETVKSSQSFDKQQASSVKDIVKYETGISTVEKGRMGSSGYMVRGVEENRVNITVDGLQQAQTLSSQGFRELFEGYGNFNNTRNEVEVENIKQVNLAKGADSTKVGSGALGGAVIFETKDARDFLIDKDFYLKAKGGYSSADGQRFVSPTFAGRYKWFDVLAIFTKRDGHQVNNFGYKDYPEDEQGRSRRRADPYDIKRESTLFKLGFNPTETSRFTFMYDDAKKHVQGRDLSYTLAPLQTEPDKPETASRHTNDQSKRRNIALSFENYDSNPFYDTLKLTASHQKIEQIAQTDEWCDGGAKCEQYDNPAGLQLKKEGDTLKVVDKFGGDVVTSRENGLTVLKDSKGNRYETYTPVRASDKWFNLSELGEDIKKIRVFELSSWDDGEGKYTDIEFDNIYDDNGTKWASVNNWRYLDFPATTGYSEGFYRKRNLSTETKDIRLDLTKFVETGSLEHHLSYGASYNETDKRMTNSEYYRVIPGTPIMWWAQRFPGTDWQGNKKQCDGSWGAPTDKLICGTTDKDLEPFSFLIPVKTTTKSLYFADNLRVNHWLSFDLGYRYDKINYKPEYIEGETPRIPDDMLNGVFIPFPEKPIEPSWKDYPKWDDYLAAREEYDKKKAEFDKLAEENPKLNREYLTRQKRKMDHHSYSLAATLDPLDWLRVQGKYSTSFRAPTSDELYFTFRHPDFSIKPNNNLKPETAKTQEIAFTFHKKNSFLTLNAFRTDYKDFIDIDFLGTQYFTNKDGTTSGLPYLVYRNSNHEKAKVKGIELSTQLFLQDVNADFANVHLGYKFSHQQGKVFRKIGASKAAKSDYVPVNAIQPDKHVVSLGYISPMGNYGIDLYWTHVLAKKAKDTYNIFHEEEGAKDTYAKYLSPSYNIFDVIGFYKYKQMTLQAGVYNLFNQKYLTWEDARSIRSIGTANRVCQRGDVKSIGCTYADQGIERFYAPERNFKVDFSMEF